MGGHKAGYVTWQSALGHKVIGAASLTVGGHMTGYVTWQSALGQKATGTIRELCRCYDTTRRSDLPDTISCHLMRSRLRHRKNLARSREAIASRDCISDFSRENLTQSVGGWEIASPTWMDSRDGLTRLREIAWPADLS